MNDKISNSFAALRSKDTRSDGHLLVGVSSTGIYCRPICRAKEPKPENCTFYSSAAEAEQAGFRPCLLCRPELAPGTVPINMDAGTFLAYRVARYLEENCGEIENPGEISPYFNCSEDYLQQVFTKKYNVSLPQYLQTCRLLLAKSLLTDTNLSWGDIAMVVGLGSSQNLSNLFQKQYRLEPASLRRKTAGINENSRSITLLLGYRPPYQWKQLLNFLAGRAIPGVETVINGEYYRTVHLVDKNQKHLYGWLRVEHRPQKNALAVTVETALLPVLPSILARVRRFFDLCCDPDTIFEKLSPMNKILPGSCIPGTRLPGCFDVFEMAARAVLGQQITVKAASTLAGRFVKAYGIPVKTGMEGLTHSFPSPETISALNGPIANYLGPLGIITARANTILALARTIVQGTVDFSLCHRPEKEIKKLKDLPGIGDWTAQYIAMRAMGWPDAFPYTDYGVKKALAPRTPREILSLGESWRPWRGYATMNLWSSL